MIVVNLFGPPGAGKSTGAAYVFSKLKMAGVNAELVTEFAKDVVWEETNIPLQNQAYVFGNQSYRISRCADKVDVVVTDSPVLLSAYYGNEESHEFKEAVLQNFSAYSNMNYFIVRQKEYNPVGRIHSEQESDEISTGLISMLHDSGIPFDLVAGTETGYDIIVKDVLNAVGKGGDVFGEKTV